MATKPEEYQNFFVTVGGNEGQKCHYPTRLDTYGCGCGHNCSYCYAKEILSGHGRWNPHNPAVVNLHKVESTLQQLNKGCILRFGGMTDCFQPAELEHRATLETIKLCNKYRIGYLLVTKSHHVADDEYMEVYDKELAHIQVSITTTDDALSATYEQASVPSKRIAAIEKLAAAGFDTQIRLSPYINGYIDWKIFNAIKCKKVLVEFLRASTKIKKWFPIDYSLYTVEQDGYWQMPLEEKLKVLKNIKGKRVTVCDDNTDHYAYWRDNFNPNPDDCCDLRHPKGVKVGPKVVIEKRGRVCVFTVTFADGFKVEEPKATLAFVNAIRHAGLEKIAATGKMVSGEPLVNKTRHAKYPDASYETPEGYWIQTHSSTNSKVRMLEKLFAEAGVDAKIELKEK